jgi:hypothetical protein
MKKKFLFAGLAILPVLLALSFAACDDGSGGDSGISTITITDIPADVTGIALSANGDSGLWFEGLAGTYNGEEGPDKIEGGKAVISLYDSDKKPASVSGTGTVYMWYDSAYGTSITGTLKDTYKFTDFQ